jgi:cbb3-type cytochrome oxidase maturation protein
MSVVLILLLASLTVALGFLAAFIWSVKTGQFDDDYTPSVRMLFDDEVRKKKPQNTQTQKTEIKRQQ